MSNALVKSSPSIITYKQYKTNNNRTKQFGFMSFLGGVRYKSTLHFQAMEIKTFRTAGLNSIHETEAHPLLPSGS